MYKNCKTATQNLERIILEMWSPSNICFWGKSNERKQIQRSFYVRPEKSHSMSLSFKDASHRLPSQIKSKAAIGRPAPIKTFLSPYFNTR